MKSIKSRIQIVSFSLMLAISGIHLSTGEAIDNNSTTFKDDKDPHAYSHITFQEGNIYESFSIFDQSIIYGEQYRTVITISDPENQNTETLNLSAGSGPGELGGVLGGVTLVDSMLVVADPQNAKLIVFSEDRENHDISLGGQIPVHPVTLDQSTIAFRSQMNPNTPVVIYNLESDEFEEITVDHDYDTDNRNITFLIDGQLVYDGSYLYYVSTYGGEIYVIDMEEKTHHKTIDYDDNTLDFPQPGVQPNPEFMLIDTAIHPQNGNLLLLKGRPEDSSARYNRSTLFELSPQEEELVAEHPFDYSMLAIFSDEDYLYTFSSGDYPFADADSQIRRYEME